MALEWGYCRCESGKKKNECQCGREYESVILRGDIWINEDPSTIQINPQPVEYAPDAFSYKDDWYMCADDMADRLIDEMYGWERPDNVEAKRVEGAWVIEATPSE